METSVLNANLMFWFKY